MRRFSKDNKIHHIANNLVRMGWCVRKGKKHLSIISPNGHRLTIPSTPSDCRAWLNFRRDVRKAIEKAKQ